MRDAIIYILLLLLSLLINFALWKIWNIRKINFLRSLVKKNRWGADRVPLTGGIVAFAVVMVGFLLLKLFDQTPGLLAKSILGSALMFILGLIDDLFELKSYQKLIGQVAIILLVVSLGVRATLLNHQLLNFSITFFWLLGITNAFNLLDNMDGLAGGVALIASLFLGISFLQQGEELFSTLCFIIAAALLGFLVFNFKPAKIYLGDSGALFVGFFLSSLTVLGTQASGKSLFSIIVFPVILMAIPIFDTLLVSITRKKRGQPVFEGGRDHLSHRLVMIGMSERQAVIFLYSISILLGLSIFMLEDLSLFTSLVIYFFISVSLLLFGSYIGKIRIAKEGTDRDRDGSAVLSAKIFYKYRILQVLIDIVLLGVVYYFSYVIRFGAEVERYQLNLFLQSVPFIILLKVLLLYYFGAYSSPEGYFDFSDAMKVVKALTIGSAVMVIFLTFLLRFDKYSRAVFLIDWMLSLLVIGGVKFFYRIFEEFFYPLREKKSIGIVFIGDRDTYKALESFIKRKEGLNYRIRSYISSEDFRANPLSVKDINILVIEDKYKELLFAVPGNQEARKAVRPLSEFMCSILSPQED